MNRCTSISIEGMRSDTFTTLRLGLYEDHYFNALQAFLILYNRDIFNEMTLKVNERPLNSEDFLQDFPKAERIRLFYNVIVDANGEIVLNCRKRPSTEQASRDILLHDVLEITYHLMKLCNDSKIDESAVMSISESDGEDTYEFTPAMMKKLVVALEDGHDNGAPNDIMTTERNHLMQMQFIELKNRLMTVEDLIYHHKLFNVSYRYHGEWQVDTVMKPLKEVDPTLHRDIELYMKEVWKVDVFIDHPYDVIHTLFRRFE